MLAVGLRDGVKLQVRIPLADGIGCREGGWG